MAVLFKHACLLASAGADLPCRQRSRPSLRADTRLITVVHPPVVGVKRRPEARAQRWHTAEGEEEAAAGCGREEVGVGVGVV